MENLIFAVIVGLGLLGLKAEATPLWFDWPFLAWGVCVALAHLFLDRAPDRARILANLSRRTPRTLYRRLVTRAFLRVQRFLRPETVADHPLPETRWKRFDWYLTPRAPDRQAAKRTMRSPFGWRLLDIALLIAVAYPVLLLLGQWAVGPLTGSDAGGRLGSVVILQPWSAWWEVAALIGALALLLGAGRLENWACCPFSQSQAHS